MGLHREEFDSDDLVKVDESNLVILASGGPLMRLVCIEGENALCHWEEGDVRRQSLFPLATLRRLVKF
jgi:uncharacterized protein YodC (DUF2158 family)